jgi:DNA-binding transcriptional LysR family regulator
VDRVLAEHGRRRTVALQVEGFGVAPGLVSDSDLVLTAPASLARLTRPMGIVDVEPPVPLPTHGIAMLWHRRFGAEPGLRWLIEQVAEVTPEVAPWS